MMNLQLGLVMKEASPARTLSPQSQSTTAEPPSRGRSKKGCLFSMVDPSDLANMADGREDLLLRSLSVSEVVAKARGGSDRLYKEAP